MKRFRNGWMSYSDMAKELGYAVKTVYNKISSGEIPLKKYSLKGVGHPRFSRWEFDRLYKDNPEK